MGIKPILAWSMLDRWISTTLLLSVVSSLFSIFASGVLGVAALALWLTDCFLSRRWRFQAPGFMWAVLAYAVWVGVSIAFSPLPLVSIINLKKLLLFAYVFLLQTYVSREQAHRALRWMFVILGSSAFLGVVQYFWLFEINLMNRIIGFMSHWMTFSGQLMIGIISLSGYLALYVGLHRLRRPDFRTMALATGVAVMAFALLLSSTRNAWLGTVVGGVLLLTVIGFRGSRGSRAPAALGWLFGLRWTALALTALVAIVLLLPAHYRDRLRSSFDPDDTTTAGRVVLLETGLNIIREHPLVGIGPRMVPRLYERYTPSDQYPFYMYQHLHNNFFQVAAESGIPSFLCWLGIWASVAWSLVKLARQSRDDPLRFYLSVNGLALLAAFLVGGFFEYNFGDSEILILLLFFLTAPFTRSSEESAGAAHQAGESGT